MSPQAHARTARDLGLRMLELINRGEFDRLAEIMDEDVITDWPQTGERVRGVRNALKIYDNYPGGGDTLTTDSLTLFEGDEGSYALTPMFTVVRSEGSGDLSSSAVKTRYPDGSEWYVVTLLRARHGKIQHVTQFFAPLLPAPEWRAEWVDPFPENG